MPETHFFVKFSRCFNVNTFSMLYLYKTLNARYLYLKLAITAQI